MIQTPPRPHSGQLARRHLRRTHRVVKTRGHIKGDGAGCHVSQGGSGIRIRAGASFPWTRLNFGYRMASPDITVFAGSIRLHGKGNYAVAEATVTLAGATEYVYVYWHRDDPSNNGITHATSEPVSDATVARVPLYKFTADSGFYDAPDICHLGDINCDLPLR